MYVYGTNKTVLLYKSYSRASHLQREVYSLAAYCIVVYFCVNLLAGLRKKTTRPNITKFGVKVAYGPRKKTVTF